MLIPLEPLFIKENNTITDRIEIPFDELELAFGTYPIREKTPVEVELFHKAKKAFSIKGHAALHIEIPCDRCLASVDYRMNIQFEKQFDLMKAALQAGNEQTDESLYVSEDECLDLEAILKDEALIAWPSKVLCKEDCKGLCPVCGHDLNVSDCGCDRVVLDPRMAAIQDIFKNSNKQP